ncbi:L-type lectin-domain containing receptor kinase IV.3 [Ananas comosus]|uniref:L-type lectin-domain containing receptor kinase IV.3 n=1 Tax=Ananas comosus TaxID=4615 RepID=A0A199VAV0_ANACO|nr:L-type lectin-domain containing receptor kinase IV.3 [Ananas comosus]
MEMVLKLGLRCSHPDPAARPGMREVVQILNGGDDMRGVVFSPESFAGSEKVLRNDDSFDEYVMFLTSTSSESSEMEIGVDNILLPATKGLFKASKI